MSRFFRSTSKCALAALTAAAVGCGSGGTSNSGGFTGGFNNNAAQTQNQVEVQNTVQLSVFQATLAQGLGAMLAGAKFMAPFATGFRTFDPNIEVPLAGDFKLTRTLLADGNFRIDIFNLAKTKLLGSAIATPARQITLPSNQPGYEVSLTLGDERFRESAPTSVTRQVYPFFGLVGEAVLQFDLNGQLVGVELKNVEQFGYSLQFGTVNGKLTPEGNHLKGSLRYGNSSNLTVDALYDNVGAFGGLQMATDLLEGQGRAFLNGQLNGGGIVSPERDPALSSPLVPTPLADPLGFSLLAPNNNRYVSYYVVDGIMTVTTPPVPPATQPSVQSYDLLSAQPQNQALPPTPLPPGARLIVRTGPSSPVQVNTRVAVSVYAVGSDGKAVPFHTNGFQLSSSNPQVARVTEGFQVQAVGTGTTTLTLTDPASGQSGTVQLTVQAAGDTGTGYVYVSDLGNSRIVRFRYNPASPALPTDRTEIVTGHAPLRILISSDKSTLMAENLDNTLQIFSINQANGNLTERSAETLSVTGLAQGQLDPTLYYGNSGSPNQIKEFRFNSANGTLTFVRNLRQGSSSRLVTGLINAGQYVYGSFQNTIHSVDVATATSRDVTMGAGEIVSDLAVTRLASGSNTLQVLLRRSLGGGAFEGTLRSFPLNNDGTLNTPASRNITVQSDASGLVVNNDRAYSGVFATGSAINGVQLALTSLTHLPGQPYPVSGTPTRLATRGNLLFVGTNPENKLETLIIGADGSLATVGAVDVGGNPTDIEAITLP